MDIHDVDKSYKQSMLEAIQNYKQFLIRTGKDEHKSEGIILDLLLDTFTFDFFAEVEEDAQKILEQYEQLEKELKKYAKLSPTEVFTNVRY